MLVRKQTDTLKDMLLHYGGEIRYLKLENGEYITPDQLYNMGIVICSGCGCESLLDERTCPGCWSVKMVLKESTVEGIKANK